MIAVKYTQGAGMQIGEAPVPLIGANEILVRVDATSICGTDIKIVRRGHRKLKEGQTIILGNEFVGRWAHVWGWRRILAAAIARCVIGD